MGKRGSSSGMGKGGFGGGNNGYLFPSEAIELMKNAKFDNTDNGGKISVSVNGKDVSVSINKVAGRK